MTGADVYAARKALGMTQVQLAVVLGFEPHRSRISDIEHGRVKLSKSKALLLERMLNRDARPSDPS
jgi:transcriptional regulator with XRE-family HTH domain